MKTMRELMREIEELKAGRDEARRFAEAAAKKYNESLVLTCAFCGQAYPDGTPATKHERLTEHVMVCAMHPLNVIIADLRARLRAAGIVDEDMEGRR